jgi:alcohol dehydrogenase class IV
MMSGFLEARQLIHDFKGDSYIFGTGVLDDVGQLTWQHGSQAVMFYAEFPGNDPLIARVSQSLHAAGVELVDKEPGAAPNAPREDLARMTEVLTSTDPEVIVCLGGGSTLDATKAAGVLSTLGGEIDDYFGTGRVSQALKASGMKLRPVVAIQTAASSGAHLTKYSNITDVRTGQKKLIVDDAIVPTSSLFDYEVTTTMPPGFTADGALDGASHCLEVLLGAVGKPYYEKVSKVAHESIRLVVQYIQQAVTEPEDIEARTALGLATDLGGYAIMIGGTNGGHLTSFSLVDVLSHGRACAIMNPYYVVFFAPAIEQPLRLVGEILADAGLAAAEVAAQGGRQLGVSVAQGMMELSTRIGFPTTLGEVEGFTEQHVTRALTAAKDPQLRMKLENMPVPLTSDMVDEYMAPVLRAAVTGDLSLIKNVE